MDFPSDLGVLASDIGQRGQASAQALLNRVDLARASAADQHDAAPVLQLKRGLLDVLGGAYQLRDTAAFAQAVAAYQGNTMFLVERFEVTAADLLIDLCLSIIAGEQKMRHAIISALSEQTQVVQVSSAPQHLAMILALICDRNHSAAQGAIQALRESCMRRDWNRAQTRLLSSFADAARCLNDGALDEFERAFGRMDRFRRRLLMRELNRIRNGLPSAMSAMEFVDLPGAALAAMVASRLERHARKSMPVTWASDFIWMQSALWA